MADFTGREMHLIKRALALTTPAVERATERSHSGDADMKALLVKLVESDVELVMYVRETRIAPLINSAEITGIIKPNVIAVDCPRLVGHQKFPDLLDGVCGIEGRSDLNDAVEEGFSRSVLRGFFYSGKRLEPSCKNSVKFLRYEQ